MNSSKYRRIAFFLATVGLLALVMIITLSGPTHAAGPWYVAPGGNDSDLCTSPGTACATINGALNKPGFVISDTILVASGTYTGTGDEVVLLDKDVTLSGGWDGTFATQSGTSTIDGEGARRGILVNSGVTAIVGCFTVQSGSANSGGGIRNNGTLTLNNSTISGNTATGRTRGGGINNGGTLTLNNSTISGNTAETGGGIDNTYGTLTLNNSTVSGNTAGLGNGGGIYNYATLTLNNSTISGNTASVGGGIGGDASSGTTILQNTILAGNTTSWIGPDCTGAIGSSGHNLIGDTSDCTFASTTGDLTNIDARLFPLIGLPGYHLLLPGSPAIDAGNPAGCTDHLGIPLPTDQRGSPRPLDGDSDSIAICDIGSYEFDPNNPTTQVFLPIVFRNYCPDFFDNFSNPASGWPVEEDSYVRSEYLNGEYRILTKKAGYFYLFKAPTCDRQNYVVEVDARWQGTPGNSYGLIFGVTSGSSQYYLFDMNTDFQQFRLLRRDAGGFTVIVPATDSAAINGGTASNHLKVTRNGDQITLEVNGTVLGIWSDGTITGLTGAGVVSSPYSNRPTSDARFDNFSMTSLPGSGAAAELGGAAAEVVDLQISGAHRDAVPADIGW